MKSMIARKTKRILSCFTEICMEWIEFLIYSMKKRKNWESNLVEVYSIKKEAREKPHVQEFIEAREKALKPNNYKMVVEDYNGHCDEETIGKASLYRKKNLIGQATLKTKKGEDLIYWVFE